MNGCFSFAGASLLTADWMQVWGSILGAALGAWLAIRGSRRLAYEQDRSSAQNYATMIYAVVQLIGIEANRLADALDSNNPRAAEQALRLLARHARVFDRFAPFSELRSFGPMQAIALLQLALESITGDLERLDSLRSANGLKDAHNVQDIVPLRGDVEYLVDAVDDARHQLLRRTAGQERALQKRRRWRAIKQWFGKWRPVSRSEVRG